MLRILKGAIWGIFFFTLVSSLLASQFVQAKSVEQPVYIIPVHNTVEKGLLAFINRSIEEAEELNAKAIILDINTPGGAVDAASEIAKSITATEIPLIAFVNKQALSAGAYIALNADEIYMTPGSTMGAAAIIDGSGNAADEKAASYWLAAMESAAEQNGRDPIYAMAMADKDIELPDLNAEKGKLLTLTPSYALQVKYSEGTVNDLNELLTKLDLENYEVVEAEVSISENIARFLTHPVIVPILLSLGSLGLVLELYSPGFGIPGAVGITALILFFYGHLVAGLAGMEAIILFIVGFILLVLELFVPGGILGIIGIVAVLTSVFLSTASFEIAAISILLAFILCIAASILLIKVFGKNIKVFERLILKDRARTEKGYVSNVNRLELIGLEGMSLTPLRPSGIAIVDEEQLDVVTEGGYIGQNKPIKVIKVEGARVVVREILMSN
ncbi:NfeD family protein [Bacillus suaedaesalsae]|uniref:NfeD family protein n=1 Tax=Bacillus suaedaesalsae TaxID=2810349 RepID=UPI001EF3EB53|nr:nodulation protein NfeD [Bacillus suaedaesalsae]